MYPLITCVTVSGAWSDVEHRHTKQHQHVDHHLDKQPQRMQRLHTDTERHTAEHQLWA